MLDPESVSTESLINAWAATTLMFFSTASRRSLMFDFLPMKTMSLEVIPASLVYVSYAPVVLFNLKLFVPLAILCVLPLALK